MPNPRIVSAFALLLFALILPASKAPPAQAGQTPPAGQTGHRDRLNTSSTDTPVWTSLTPVARYAHTAIYDHININQRMIVYGGGSDGGSGARLTDVWTLSLSGTPTWTQITPSGSAPPARIGHTAVYDSAQQRMIIFGGKSGSEFLNDTSALWLNGTPTWTELTPSGSTPAARIGHTAIYDSANHRMIISGGTDSTDFLSRFGDVWALSLIGAPTWTRLTPSGSAPAARSSHTAIYDTANQRMIVFGGSGYAGSFNDAWTLSLSATPAWTQLTPSGSTPAARIGHTAIYDSAQQRMIVFAGYRGPGNDFLNDVWALSLTGAPAWTELTPTGAAPANRASHTAIYDSARQRMIVYGGTFGYDSFGDVWALSLTGTPAWTELIPGPTGSSNRAYLPVVLRARSSGG